MERRDSQDWLELVRPERPDPDLPNRTESLAQLASDADLRARVARIAEFDDTAARIIQDVSTPPGLKAGILGRLAEETSPAGVRRRVRRRTFGIAASAVAAL